MEQEKQCRPYRPLSLPWLPDRLQRWLRPVPVTVEWTDTEVVLEREGREYRENLPPAFCQLNFFKHPAETAEWLHTRLPARQASACRWILPEGAACLQPLTMPPLEGQELQEFLRWEGPQSIPLEEDTFYLEGLCGDDLPSGLPGETTLLLAALPKEHVAGLTAIGMSLGLATEGVTIRTDGQVLPVNFVPPPLRRSGQWKSRLYRVAAVVLLAGTGARAAWAAYGLYDAREASLQAAAAMTAWRSVAREYGAAQAEKQDAAARRTAWLQAKRRHPSWYGTCLVLARTIPPDCCLTEIVQEEAAEGHGFRIRGEALGSGSIRRFTAALEQERTLADVRLLETGIRQGRQTFSLRFVRTEPEKEGTP